jgi:rhodanese-related sulfurtransferase
MQSQVERKPLETNIEDAKTIQATFIDCRSAEEFEDSHLVNAINIPLQHLSIRQDTFPCNKGDTFFVYCKTGNRSKTFVTYLRSIGYSNCYSIKGGYENWGEESTC